MRRRQTPRGDGGRERIPLWPCIKVLEQKPVSHSSAAVCDGTFIQPRVREGRNRDRQSPAHLLLRVTLFVNANLRSDSVSPVIDSHQLHEQL